MSERVTDDSIPIFSPRLDEVMAAMIKGTAPNAGRFCGHCYTPLSRSADVCRHCGVSTASVPTLAKVPPELFTLYRRMRKRESLIVNAFAFAGLGIGLVLFIGLVAVAVYRYDASLWMLAAATAVLFVTGRVFAGILGGWIGDHVGYNYARRKLVDEWRAFERERASGKTATPPAQGIAAEGAGG